MYRNSKSAHSAPLRRGAIFILAGTIAALLATPRAKAATVIFDGGPDGTGSALDEAANWNPDGVPIGGMQEVLFDNIVALPSQLTTSTVLEWGNLIWDNNRSSAITLDANAAGRALQIFGSLGTEAIAHGGAAGDLILLGTNATSNTLSIGGSAGTGSAALALGMFADGNLNVVNSGATLDISATIFGNVNLTKTGAGTLTLSGANMFGSTATSFTLAAGQLNINSASALGDASNTFVITGGTFDNTSGEAITTGAYKQRWDGDFTFKGSDDLAFGNGAITLGTAPGTSRTVTVTDGTLTLAGAISNGTTANSIIKDGAGTLALNGAGSYTGGVTIKSGTVAGGVSTAFGTAAGVITLGDTTGSQDATLVASSLSTASLSIANAIVVASGSSGNKLTIRNADTALSNTSVNGAITLGHDLVLEQASSSYLYFNGAITEVGGARAITLNAGSGTISLATANNFTGGLTLNNGRLRTATGGTGTGIFTINGGSLDAGSGATLNNSAYHWNGDFVFRGVTAVTMAGGDVTINGDRILNFPSVISSSAQGLTIAGGIGDGGNGYSFTKRGATHLTLQGVSTYSGATILEDGPLNLTSATSELRNTSSVTVTGGVLTIGRGSGTAVPNRINPNAPLTVGGSGTVTIAADAVGPNTQDFTQLNILPGSAQIGSNSTSNPGRIAFTGTAGSVYNRTVGGTVRFTVSNSHSFTNAPTGASISGNGGSAILIGAVSGTGSSSASITDFVRAGAGAIDAPAYSDDTWQAGANTNVLSELTVSGNTQSLRFGASGRQTVTLTGTSTIESGGILVPSTSVGGGVITGGTLQAASGQDLWMYVSTAANNPQGLTIESRIGDNNGSSLTKSGPGTLFLRNETNSYAGGTYLNEGIINITSGSALGTGPLRFTGTGTLQSGANLVDLGNLSITIGRAQVGTFDAAAPTHSITHSGVISGEGGLTKTGLGSLTLTGKNTYSGPTNVSNGTLILDFNAAGAPDSNIISSDSLVSVGTGAYYLFAASSQTIAIKGKAGAASSQTFGGTYTSDLANDNTIGLYTSRGMSHLDLTAGEGGSLTVDVGRIARGYSIDQNAGLDIKMGPNVTVLTSAPNGLLGAFATVNGTSWATAVNGTIVPYASYSSNYAQSNAVLNAGTGGTLSANPSYLRFDNNTAATVNTGTGVVRAITQGGILVTPNVGANLSTISGGALVGYSGRDLVIHQNNTDGELLIDASIVNTAARVTSISKHGLGTTILTGQNTNTGQTYVNEGTLIVTGDTNPAFDRMATSTASSNVLTMTDTSGIFIGQEVTQGTALKTSSTTWTVVAIVPNESVTLSANASAAFNGTFNFGASGGLGVGLLTHYIGSTGTLQIGNGGTTGSIILGQAFSNQGTLVFNRSDDFTFVNTVSGTGSLEKRGAGITTLGVSSSFTGDTRIYEGVLKLDAVSALQSSMLDYSGYGGSLSFGTLTSASLGGLKGNQALVLTNEDSKAVTLTIGSNAQDSTYTGGFSGLGSVSKTGGGSLTIGGTNTYAGSTFASQGILNLEGAFTDTGSLSISGGVVNLSGTYGRTEYSTVGGFTISGGILNITGTLGTSALIPTGQSAFSGNSVTNLYGTAYMSGASSTFRVGDPSPATFNVLGGSLTIGNSGAGFVIGRGGVNGKGTFNLVDGSVTIGGNSTVVRIGAAYADGESGAGPSVMTISGGLFTTGTTRAQFLLGSNSAGNTTGSGTLNLDGGTLATARVITGGSVGQSFLNLNGGVFQATGNTASIAADSLTEINVRDGGAVFDTNGFDISIPAVLAHSAIVGDAAIDGGLLKRGEGTLALSGANSFTGATVIEEGTLSVASVASIGTAQPLGVASSAILLGNSENLSTFEYTGGDGTLDREFVIGTSGGAIRNTGTGTFTLGGPITTTTGTLIFSGELQVTGAITGSAESGLTVQGGTTTLANAENSFALAVVRTGATLKNGITNALPTSSVLMLSAPLGDTIATYDLNGYDQTLGGLRSGTEGGQIITNSAEDGTALLTVHNTADDFDFGGVIQNGASAAVALAKAGNKILTLGGANTYTGGTEIIGGTLSVTGSISGTAWVEVGSTGVLQLAGAGEQVNDTAGISLDGGTFAFADGLSGTTETAGALTLSADSFVDFGTGDSNTFAFSDLALNGNVLNVFNWTGSLYYHVQPEPDHGGLQDRLLFGKDVSMANLEQIRFYADAGSTLIGTGAQIAFGDSGFQIVPVPEPTSALLTLGAFGLLGLTRRRGRRS